MHRCFVIIQIILLNLKGRDKRKSKLNKVIYLKKTLIVKKQQNKSNIRFGADIRFNFR